MTQITEEMRKAAIAGLDTLDDILVGVFEQERSDIRTLLTSSHVPCEKCKHYAPAQSVGDDTLDALKTSTKVLTTMFDMSPDFSEGLRAMILSRIEINHEIILKYSRPAPDSVTDDEVKAAVSFFNDRPKGFTDLQYQHLCALIKAATTPKNEPEVVTVDVFYRECSKYRSDCRLMGEYLSKVYPNGVKIVEGK